VITSEVVTVEDVDRVRLVGIDRPEVHNALNHDVVTRLCEAIRSRPAEIRCVVLFGHGPSFCAGGDRRQGIASPDGETRATLEMLQEITRRLQDPLIVSIAAVEGWAIGGGAELALACDIVVAGHGATFRFPEVELDAHATGGSTWLLPRTVGLGRAKLLLLTGMPVDATAAHAAGLVAEVIADGRALARARELATGLAGYSPATVASLKRSIEHGLDGTLEESLAIEVQEAHPRLGPGGFRGPTVEGNA
jgi:enoyl-CoA hydratase/carnithine racemase